MGSYLHKVQPNNDVNVKTNEVTSSNRAGKISIEELFCHKKICVKQILRATIIGQAQVKQQSECDNHQLCTQLKSCDDNIRLINFFKNHREESVKAAPKRVY